MKPNRAITKRVSESIKDFRTIIIKSTILLCRQVVSQDDGCIVLVKPVAITSSLVNSGKIVTASAIVSQLYFWYGDELFLISDGKDDNGATFSSKMLTLDSLVAIYEAVKKTVSKE